MDIDCNTTSSSVKTNLHRPGQPNMTPITILPPEILTGIFLHACELAVGSYTSFARTSKLVELWKALTHTCRYWREVSLGCAQLWAFIKDDTKRYEMWALSAIERSSSALLSIVISRSEGFGPLYLEKLLLNMSRVQKLSLYQSFGRQSESHGPSSLTALLSNTPAPCLERLEMEPDSGVSSLCGLFADYIPMLRELHLDCSKITSTDWNAGILRCQTITSLSIEKDLGNRPRLYQFINILHSLPNLASLSLKYACPVHRVSRLQQHHESNGARLPHLRRLVLEDNPQLVEAALDCIDISAWSRQAPPSICIIMYSDIKLQSANRTLQDLRNWFSGPLEHDEAGSYPLDIDTVHISGRDVPDGWYTETRWTFGCGSQRLLLEHGGQMTPRSSSWLGITLKDSSWGGCFPPPDTFIRANSSLFGSVTKLSVAPDLRGETAYEWSEVLSAFSVVRQVQLYNVGGGFITALFAPSALDLTLNACLKEMTDLEFRGTQFEAAPRVLAQWVQRRAGNGMRMKKLWIIECGWLEHLEVTAEDVESTRKTILEHVDDLKWEL